MSLCKLRPFSPELNKVCEGDIHLRSNYRIKEVRCHQVFEPFPMQFEYFIRLHGKVVFRHDTFEDLPHKVGPVELLRAT
jgi:hypothetical protein